jgi:hypothetical protein
VNAGKDLEPEPEISCTRVLSSVAPPGNELIGSDATAAVVVVVDVVVGEW